MMQIISTTDQKYIGLVFDETQPLILDGVEFDIEKVQSLADGVVRLSNSNYVIEAKEL